MTDKFPKFAVGDHLQLSRSCTNYGQKVEIKEILCEGSTYIVTFLPHGIQLLTYYASELEPITEPAKTEWVTLNADHEVITFGITSEKTALEDASGNADVAFIARITHTIEHRTIITAHA